MSLESILERIAIGLERCVPLLRASKNMYNTIDPFHAASDLKNSDSTTQTTEAPSHSYIKDVLYKEGISLLELSDVVLDEYEKNGNDRSRIDNVFKEYGIEYLPDLNPSFYNEFLSKIQDSDDD